VLIGVLTAVAPDSIAYFNVALAVSFAAVCIFAHLKPLEDPSSDRLQICALVVTWLTIFYGLVSASTKYGLPDAAQHADERTVQARQRHAVVFARDLESPHCHTHTGVSVGGLARDHQHRSRAGAARRVPLLEAARSHADDQTLFFESQASFVDICVRSEASPSKRPGDDSGQRLPR
jgi:hypothetical protein